MGFDSNDGGGGGDQLTQTTIDDTDSPYNTSDNEFVWVDASSGTVTVNVPTPGNDVRFGVTVIDATNNVTISRSGTETIDGDASDDTLSVEDTVRQYISDGTDWRTIAYDPFEIAAKMFLANAGIEFQETDSISIRADGTGSNVRLLNFESDGSTRIQFSVNINGPAIRDRTGGGLKFFIQNSGQGTDFAINQNDVTLNPQGTAWSYEDATETADGMTADPETATEDAFLTLSIGSNTYHIPLYGA